MRDEPAFVLGKVREALADELDEEIVAGLTVSAASRAVRRAVPDSSGTRPRVGRYGLLAMTPTRLLLFEAKPAVRKLFVRPKKLVGDWPLDQARVDAKLIPECNDAGGPHGAQVGTYAVRVRSGDVDAVIEAGYGFSAEAILGQIAGATGGDFSPG